MSNKPLPETCEDLKGKIFNNIRLLNEDIISSLEKKCLSHVNIDHRLESRISLYSQLNIRRTLELLKSISICAEHHLVLPIILSARAFLETIAAFNAFHVEFEKAIKEKNFAEAYIVLSKHIRQTRNDVYLKHLQKNSLETKEEWRSYEAKNIITNIEKLNKINAEAKKSYDVFSERCHPNFDGLFGLYAVVDSDNMIYFENSERQLNEILDAMLEVKRSGKPFYETINKIRDLINDHEPELKKYYSKLSGQQ